MRTEYVFNENQMLKGGLHCHTVRSDGKCTPKEVLKIHKENGYDFLAITDHRIYNFENFAPEYGITVIPGMEFDNGKIKIQSGFRCYHTVCLGYSKEKGNPYEQDQIFERAKALTQEEYQPYLDTLHQNQNLTVYCHPEWSATPARYFEKLKGNFAMEIWNTGCVMESDMDDDASYWDELLGQGIQIYGVAVDDGHLKEQHCKGWVMVQSENHADAILDALSEGNFYSSCGPKISYFGIKDQRAVIDCSNVSKIRLHSERHPTKIISDVNGGLHHAEFPIDGYDYVRISIVDQEGNKAWTNPIYLNIQ